MDLWAYAIRELLQHLGRSLFILFGIATGVAAAVAALAASESARGQYRELFNEVAGSATLEVYAPGEAGFDPVLAVSLSRLPGVRAAWPTVQATGGMPSWYSSAAVVVRANRLCDGEPEPRNNHVFVTAALAESHGLKPGGRLRIWGTAELADLTIAAVLPPSTRPGSGSSVVVSLATAQRLFGFGERVNLIRVELDDTAELQTVKSAIAANLPPGFAVREPAGRADITRGLRAASAQGLTGLTALALAGAGYIVFGLAQLNLLARRPELAILRTLGASTRQIEGILLRHSLLLGCCGGVLGTACGALLAWVVLGGAGTAMGHALAAPRVGWGGGCLGIGLGLCISLCAVWLPARQACRNPPLALLRTQTNPAGTRSRVWLVPVATLLLVSGAGLLTGCATGRIAPERGRLLFPLALALTLAGMAGVVAPCLPRMLARLEHPTRAIFGLEGMIAIRQLSRRPDHTARTGGVVFITVTMVVGFGHTVLNTLADVRAWTDRAIPAHLLVRGAPPDPGFVLNVPLPESVGGELRGLGGVARVEQIAFIPTTVNGSPVLVLARTFAPDQPLPLDLRGADDASIREGLQTGEAVLADGLATSLRLRVGESLAIDTPTGPRTVRVAGVVTEYAVGGRALYLDWNTATSLFGPCGVHVFLVTTRAGAQATAESEVTRYCSARGLFLQRNHELRKTVDHLTRGLTVGLWALLAVMIAIAGLGVVSAVTLVAQEQQRNVETLRAVGMLSRRIRRAFRFQATFLTISGLPAGALCGVALALMLNHTIRGLWGYGVPFEIQWDFLLGVTGATLFTGIVTGYCNACLPR